ncbi:C-type lectin 37Db-like [Drosophila rhopaloa]|uniref:Accessory gland protein Acp29AB-like n=1 Tax=Drosophila rhopaloa TaxID=1041015 RepID=A0A6P4F6I4_DRORH|nr:C-type lectin 37Db-like [Drosophila rhopaloa]
MFKIGICFLYAFVAYSLCGIVKSEDNANTQAQLNSILAILNRIQERLDKIEDNMEMARSGFEKIGFRNFYIENDIATYWNVAEATCREKGGYLAAFQNQLELDKVKSKLRPENRYWLGINDRAKEGDFISVASGKPATFLRWYMGEPNNFRGSEDCVSLKDGLMSDSNCETIAYYICQLDNEV